MPAHSPLISLGRYVAFCASDPESSRASMAPCVSMGQRVKETLAPFQISSTSAETRRGAPWPPCSGLEPSPIQPPSVNAE